MELINLRISDVHVDRRSDTVVLTLAKTKTARNHAQTVAMQHSGLAKLMLHLLQLHTPGPIWRYPPRGFRMCFAAIISHCRASSCSFTVYSLRRGGATHAYVCSRSLDLVVVQGRWRDQRMAGVYLDDARAALLKMNLPEGLKRAMWHYRLLWPQLLNT